MEMTTDMLAPEDVLAPAKTAAPAELNALALLTIKPEEYVAQVFAPFHAKLATLKAEADAIHFDSAATDAAGTYVDITTTAGMAVALKYRAAFRDDVRLDVGKAKTVRKAPILEIGRLIDSTYKGIVEQAAPYEGKFDVVIKAEEKRKADIAAEKERVKAERIGVIQAAIEAIRALPARAAGKSAEELRALLERVAARVITKEEFDQFEGEAQTALNAAGEELVAMYGAAQNAEAAAAKAEADKQAELKAIADQRAEQAKVAAEQAATAKRLADAEAELQKQRDIAAAAARVEANKVAAANAAAAKVIADAAADLAAKQAEFQRKQDEAAAADAKAKQDAIDAEDARKRAAQDAIDAAAREAAELVEREADRVRLQEDADQALVDGRERQNDEHVAGMPAGALGSDVLFDLATDDDANGLQVLECCAKAVADKYSLSILEAIDLIELIGASDFDAARTLAEAA